MFVSATAQSIPEIKKNLRSEETTIAIVDHNGLYKHGVEKEVKRIITEGLKRKINEEEFLHRMLEIMPVVKCIYPTEYPSQSPSKEPSTSPTGYPSMFPTVPPSHSPTKDPSGSPSDLPTENPSLQPTKKHTQCVLKATLFYPYNDPEESPYMGYHSDYLLVQISEDPSNYCDGDNPYQPWCTYVNTDPNNGNAAYIGRTGDDYYDDILWNETITIKDYFFEDTSLTFYVTHWFNQIDHNPENPNWKDHLMPAILTIKNENEGRMLSPSNGWSHPVDVDIPTHTEDGKINPDYEGSISISIICSKMCDCNVAKVIGL